MATTYWLDARGRYYSSTTGAASTSDSQITNVSSGGATAITSTPTDRGTVQDTVENAAISAGTRFGPVKKYH